MAEALRRLYWDTTCFICFLNQDEAERRLICDDILRHARDGKVLLYTSTFTIAEVLYPKRSSIQDRRKLTPNQADKIAAMFKWRWLRKYDVDQRVAQQAAELARKYELLPADAIHAATAIVHAVDELQHWDRDFSKIGHLIQAAHPNRMSPQNPLPGFPEAPLGPTPGDFALKE